MMNSNKKEVYIQVLWKEGKDIYTIDEIYNYNIDDFKNYMKNSNDTLSFISYEYSTYKNEKYHSLNEEHSCFIFNGSENYFIGRLYTVSDIINSCYCDLEVAYHENGCLHNLNDIAYYCFEEEEDSPMPDYYNISDYYINGKKYEKEDFFQVRDKFLKQKREQVCKDIYNNSLLDADCSSVIASYLY